MVHHLGAALATLWDPGMAQELGYVLESKLEEMLDLGWDLEWERGLALELVVGLASLLDAGLASLLVVELAS